jgi:hypothetical protein
VGIEGGVGLSRARVALGLAGVVVATAWAVGGVHGLGAGGLVILKAIPALLVALGAVLLLRAVVPRSPVMGPLVLVLGGSLALAIQFDLVTAGMLDDVAPVLLAVAGIAVAMSKSSRDNPLAAIVSHHWSVILPSRRNKIEGMAPHKFVLRCFLGDLLLDLTDASYPVAGGGSVLPKITVDVTVFGGWLEIRVPHDWSVHAGRAYLTRLVRFEGQLSSAEEDDNLVVLNIQGWSGRVIVRRVQASDPPSAEGGSVGEAAS